MRLILFDILADDRINFRPLALSRPIWELRCGMTTLGEKLIAMLGAKDVAYFVPDYMADAYRERTRRPVNDVSSLTGDDLLLVNPIVKATGSAMAAFQSAMAPAGKPGLWKFGPGASEVGVDSEGRMLYAVIAKSDLAKLKTGSIDELFASAKETLSTAEAYLPTWNYIWDLVLANPEQITADFAAAGRHGIEGKVEQPTAVRGNEKDVYIAPGVMIHPMVVIDAAGGPVYIDEGAEIHPFTRIEGPCYIGPKSVLLGAKCREGNSIGPVCRIGGEIEESIIQGYSNKYHDGFLGHAYVGEWVNLGALTTNSDLKNDYSTVSVTLDGHRPIDTGSTKVGSLIGDHTKTSIGALFNTGAYVGAMAIILATGKPLPKFIPSFAWLIDGYVTKGFGRKKLYETAQAAMGRRDCQWTAAQRAMWDAIFEMTAPPRDQAIKKGRRQRMSSRQK